MRGMRRMMASAAATALLAAGGVAAASSASAGTMCKTVEGARACASVVWPVGSDIYYGRATATDLDGGPNLSVAVRDIRLQHYTGTRWVTVRSVNEYDGWFAAKDTGTTGTLKPCSYRNPVFRTVATVSWKGGQSGSTTITSRGHIHNCPS